MTYQELYNIRKKWLNSHIPYVMEHYNNYDFRILNNIMYRRRAGRGDNSSYNDCIIMADTETSKSKNPDNVQNHVVAWTISIRAFDRNICTLWGRKPSEFIDCLNKLRQAMQGEQTIIYFHNLSYDYVFLRKFFFNEYGYPVKQLATKPHYPIYLQFDNGLIIRDSLILAQRSLEKWAKDMNVEHQKAVGKWDYDKYRNQNEFFNSDELEYIEHDTLAGIECIDALKNTLKKDLYSMPYTATGIPRNDVRELGKENNAKRWFNGMVCTYNQQVKLEQCYHGGYTHGNRHIIDIILEDMECRDFASSYPYTLLGYMFPSEKFFGISDCNYQYILDNMEEYAFMFKLIMIKPRLKNDNIGNPALQFSKAVKNINSIVDNGRIIASEYVEIYLTEYDLDVIIEQYDFDAHICCEVETARKDYLPRWLTDYIYQLFKDKTMLKNGDPVLYALAKAKLNSVYGMHVQKPIKLNIAEDYVTGEYYTEAGELEELYEKYTEKRSSILPYQIGVWVTAIAFYNLFQLAKCCDFVYSDTDSVYGQNWNTKKVEEYNNQCKERLTKNGYGAVVHNGREYWLGVAELDGEYSEFVVQGAKRYCGRSKEDGELHITVAGVPKSGAKCLHDDIHNFTNGMIFTGAVTGKLTHSYIYVDDIEIDEDGNEVGDSVNLTPCDYLLDSVNIVHVDDIEYEEVEIQVYGEEEDAKLFRGL